jgi:hypothetical protein
VTCNTTFLPFFEKGVEFCGMKKIFPLLFVALMVCTACAPKPATFTYSLRFDLPETSKQMALVQATESVVKRKLKAIDITNASVLTSFTGSGAGKLSIQANSDQKKMIDGLLSEKFTFEIKGEKKVPVSGQVPNPENWEQTGMTSDMLLWASASSSSNGTATIDLEFNSAGQKILLETFKKYEGRSIGIFVRDFLVSKLKVEGTAHPDRVVITGVPSAQVAKIFVDDVNVGIHTSITPTR